MTRGWGSLPWPFSSSPVANCSKNSCLRTQHLTQHGHPGKPSRSRTPSSRVAQAPASDARWIPSLMRVCLHRSPPRSPMSAGRGSWLLAHVDQHTLQHTRVRLTVLRLVHSLLGALVAPDVVRDVPQLAESLPPWWHSLVVIALLHRSRRPHHDCLKFVGRNTVGGISSSQCRSRSFGICNRVCCCCCCRAPLPSIP